MPAHQPPPILVMWLLSRSSWRPIQLFQPRPLWPSTQAEEFVFPAISTQTTVVERIDIHESESPPNSPHAVDDLIISPEITSNPQSKGDSLSTLLALTSLAARMCMFAFMIWRTAVSVQRSAFSVQRSAFSVQRSAVSVQRSAVSGQRSAVSGLRLWAWVWAWVWAWAWVWVCVSLRVFFVCL